MNPFAVIERGCAEFVERSFARVFPSRVEPVQIARRLVSVLEASDPPPTRYTVRMRPHDYDELASDLPDLIASWEQMLAEMAERLNLMLSDAPKVSVDVDPDTLPGRIPIAASGGAVIRRLRIKGGTGPGAVATVFDQLVAGRAADVGLTLLDPSVSRRHASFVLVDGALRVTDLGSMNGTHVRDRRIDTALVHRGDSVRLGDCELIVE